MFSVVVAASNDACFAREVWGGGQFALVIVHWRETRNQVRGCLVQWE